MKNWIFGKNENCRYAHYNGDIIRVFLTFSITRFGLGATLYYHVLSEGGEQIPKIIIDLLFFQINLTYHKKK